MRAGSGQAVLAGVVTAVVGFTSAFAVVLTGLRHVGASPAQAASGLFAVCVTMGAGCLWFSLRYRRPLTMAWSTPGAALLASVAAPHGGYAAAVGAFVVAGVLYLLTGLVSPLGRLVARIPSSLASAMLAGVLLGLCVEPVRALTESPWAVAPVLLTWLVMLRLAPRWAVPVAFGVVLLVVLLSGSLAHVAADDLVPRLTWTTPHLEPGTALALGIPLYLVTMTGQNIPGVAVLSTYGYEVPFGPALTYTGAATVATAGLGGFSINLSAIAAALCASPTAHPDPDRRWIAGTTTGVVYVLFGPLAAAVVAITNAAPAGVVAAIAGVALLASFGTAAATALADEHDRVAAALTFVVAASGVSIAGLGAAFWALVAGAVLLLVTRRSHARG
ncbi:benzoate transporter BenE [Nocardioides mangrovicus]|uniref:Benzoate transporter BenE n=1 Tax=Nocardioides mangrovicus TaxID=2478913 RepID=A0A3L8P3C5_9ACTN|nr:benzoate/H(+) symporter BenE family transporter [Nocardioides mangrovicus]RLV49936.1 benzoate transporter BenE [Nocardioides mangrovicus]